MHSCWLGDFHGEPFLTFSLLSMEKKNHKTKQGWQLSVSGLEMAEVPSVAVHSDPGDL